MRKSRDGALDNTGFPANDCRYAGFRTIHTGIAIATPRSLVTATSKSLNRPAGLPEPKSAADVWLLLSVPVVGLLAIAAGGGLFVPGVYRDAPFFAVQAVAQDFITLFVVMPTVAVSAWLVARGSNRARLVWLGALVYTIYSYVIAAFEVRFNRLFLVYIALFGCALYALIGGVAATDIKGIKDGFANRAPVKSVSAFLSLLAVMFYAVWLSEAVPAVLAGTVPLSVQQNATPTNAVHVLDMAWILPAFLISASHLARRTPLGYTLAGAALTFVVLLVIAVLSMVFFMTRDGYPVVVAQLAIFGSAFVVALVLLMWYLKALQAAPPELARTEVSYTAQ
jgi:hypothetical protein